MNALIPRSPPVKGRSGISPTGSPDGLPEAYAKLTPPHQRHHPSTVPRHTSDSASCVIAPAPLRPVQCRMCIASTPSLSPAPHSLTAFPRLPSGSARSLRQRTSGRLRCSGSTRETLTGPDSVRPREESGISILIRDCARQSRPQTLIRGGGGPRSAYRTQDCPRHSRVQTCRNGIGPRSQRFNIIPPMYDLADYPTDCRY